LNRTVDSDIFDLLLHGAVLSKALRPQAVHHNFLRPKREVQFLAKFSFTYPLSLEDKIRRRCVLSDINQPLGVWLGIRLADVFWERAVQ